MYESMSNSDKAKNKLQRTSLLPTYRENDGQATLTDLDFDLDEGDSQEEKIDQKAFPQLALNFEEEEPQAKESKNINVQQTTQSNFAMLFDSINETPEQQNVELSQIQNADNLQTNNIFNLITERDTERISTKAQSSAGSTSGTSFKLPNISAELPKLKSYVSNDIDSDSDGWGETAKRLNIDMGNKSPHDSQQSKKEESDTDSDDIPLCQPIKKMNFGLSINLNKVEEKNEDKKKPALPPTLPKIQESQEVNANLKMHLVLAKQSSRQSGQQPKEPSLQEQDIAPSIQSVISLNNVDALNLPSIENTSYGQTEVPVQPIYCDDYLHFTIIRMILDLLINPKTGGLDGQYVTQFPSNNGLTNIPYYLHNHLNSMSNKKIVEMLIKIHLNDDERRLLRLLCYSQFNPQFYDLNNYTQLAKGAYGEVYSGYLKLTNNPNYNKFSLPVALKLQQLSAGVTDRCVLHDIYQEVTVLEKLQEDQNFCQILDYGVTPQGYIIVMKQYYTSFKNFREQLFMPIKLLKYSNKRKMIVYGHEQSMMKYVRLFLLTFECFLDDLISLQETYKIIHFDLKSDNIFLFPASIKWLSQPHSPHDQKQFANDIMTSHLKAKNYQQLPYRIAIADFGESHLFSSKDDENTLLSKGTEFDKSPEMLLSTNQQFAKTYNRRQQKGAGKVSDNWSAACVLYELLTNDYLFYDSDWIRFFLRVSTQQQQIIYAKDSFTFSSNKQFSTLIKGISLPPEKRAMLGNCQPLIDLLEYMLVQDPSKRPSLETMKLMTEYVKNTYFPFQYKFDEIQYCKNEVPTQQQPDQLFDYNGFDFSVIGSVDQCMAQPQDILAPECSVIIKDNKLKGTKLSTLKTIEYKLSPSDLFNNKTVFLGAIHDTQDQNYINSNSISTVIDCSQNNTKKDIKIQVISHIYRPNQDLISIHNGTLQKVDRIKFDKYCNELEEVFDVIRCQQVKNSSILIVDENGTDFSVSIAVACLIEFENMNIYSAAIYLKRIRPNIKISQPFIEFLITWIDSRSSNGVKMIKMFPYLQICKNVTLNDPEFYQLANQRVAQSSYRCLCGKTYFLQKMFSTVRYVACNCNYSNKNEATFEQGQALACPCTSCKTLLNYYLSLYGLKVHKMLYCYGKEDDFNSNWQDSCISADQVPKFENSEQQQLQFFSVDNMRCPLYRLIKKDGWTLYICKICGLPTHFIRNVPGEAKQQICVICNISQK